MLEEGRIFFFYRPRVGLDEVRNLTDVHRFFFVLTPQRTSIFRRCIVGRKRLPDPATHERGWAFVAEVTKDPRDLRDELGPRSYETKTRGLRVERPARAVGKGRYGLVEHERHSRLAYVLASPIDPGRAQDLFRIRSEASYVAAVRNPAADVPAGLGLPPRERPQLPPELMNRFAGRRFAMLDPAFLDFTGVEIVLIGASESVGPEFAIELGPDSGPSPHRTWAITPK